MDSTASVKAIWKEGDSCLAPNPKDGILQEAKIQRVLSTSNNNHAITTALVIFTDQNKQDEEKEVTIPVAKLLKPVSNQLSHEKPLFPSIQHPRVAVPLVLDHVAGETVPYTINRYLRDYQREGIKFLYNNYIRSGGCILGDDMGLGKTVQIIGFLSAVLRKTGTWEDIENNRPQFLLTQAPSKQGKANKVFLIIAPLSVLYNWKDELETWGHFQCLVIHGPRKEEELARIKNGRLEIALTTYETLRLCLDRFNSIDWTAVIVDEAHKLKNPKSQITRAMKELKCKVRIGLTGTILQNNLEELWCVMDWAIPGCLGTLGHFKNKFSDPIEQGQRHSATKRALAIGRKTVRALASKISRWFLRRTKAIIKDQLPKKDDRVVYCSLTDFQQTVYETVLESEDVALLLRSADKCDCQSGRTQRSCCYRTNSDGVQVRRLYFSYLAILRKVANHVALLQSTDGTSEKQKTIVSAICNKVFQKFPDFMQRCKEEAFEAISDPMYSGKIKVLQKLLSLYMKKRDKVLIFSLSTKLLDVLQSYCMAEGLDFSRLDGTTKSKERLTIVKEFNSSPHTNLCLVSTMAGGLGLNFVGANVVVLFDPTWNPANDLQAIDRAYRIGQCRDVTVLRLISLGTVEEIIYLRQVYKQQLQSSVVERECARRYFEAVQGADGQKGELFGLKNLFRLQTQGTCLTRCLLEREGRVEAGVMTTSTHAGVEREDESTETSEVGELPPSDVSKPSGRTANENMAASMIPKGVLDFSSGSDEDDGERRVKRKAMEPYREDGQDGAGSPASRLSLLQCGFSRLLQGVAGRASHQEEDSSQSEAESRKGGSSEGHDVVDAWSSGKEITSAGSANLSGTPGNECSARVLELKTSTWDTSRGSDKEEGGLLDSRRRRGGSTEGESDRTGRQNAAHEKWMGAKRRLGRESDKIYRSDKKELNKAQAAPPGRKDLEGDSDESDDLDIAVKPRVRKEAFNRQEGETKRDVEKYRADRTRKRRSIRARSKRSEDIEAFTSSDEEHTPVKRGTSKTMFLTSPKTQTRRDGTIDSVLGAVSQVLYTHSNQCVVGGSKAEERLSSAAARDVFERKMYSQLPANHLGTQESLSEDGLVSRPGPSAGRADAQGEAKRVESLRVQHPVAFTRQAIHYSRDTTFIIGQTPPAIRRKQLEQMAARFNMSSVHQFAEEVLRCSSTQRLAWLRQYYTSLNQPKLAEMVTVQFPEPDAAQSNSQSAVLPSSSMPEHKGSSWKAGEELGSQIQKTSVFEPPTSSRNPHRSGVHASEQVKETVSKTRERKRTRLPSVSSSGPSRAAAHLYSDKMGQRDDEAPTSLVLSGVRSTTPVKPIAPDKRTRLESSPRVPEAVGGQPGKACPPSCHSEATSTTSARSLLTDLIGDTSILDDLFRPTLRGTRPAGPRSETPLTTHPHSITSPSSTSRATRSAAPSTSRTPSLPATPQKSAAGRKDFWDILNEGSEESISMLTDMSALERACVRTSHPAHNRSGEKGGVMTGLWKMNDKFLWKK